MFKECNKKLKESSDALNALGRPCDDTFKRRQVFVQSVGQCASLLEWSIEGKYTGPFFEDAQPQYGNNLLARQFKLETEFRQRIMQTRSMCTGVYEAGDSVLYMERDATIVSQLGPTKFRIMTANQKCFDVDVVCLLPQRRALLDFMENVRGDGLPGSESQHVFNVLVQSKLVEWPGAFEHLCQSTVDLVEEVTFRIIETAAANAPPGLRVYLEGCVKEIIGGAKETLHGRMLDLLQAERERPYTQNDYYLTELRKMRHQQLDAQLKQLRDQNGAIDYNAMRNVLLRFGIGTQSIEEEAAIETEFRLTAYLKVACKRVIDQMPMLVNVTFIRPVLEGIRRLQAKADDTTLQAMFVEEKSTIFKRKMLADRISTLKLGIESLEHLFQM